MMQGSASGSLYVDDGHSYKNKNGDYIHRTFTFSGRTLSSKPTHSAFMTVPSNGTDMMRSLACSHCLQADQDLPLWHRSVQDVLHCRARGDPGLFRSSVEGILGGTYDALPRLIVLIRSGSLYARVCGHCAISFPTAAGVRHQCTRLWRPRLQAQYW